MLQPQIDAYNNMPYYNWHAEQTILSSTKIGNPKRFGKGQALGLNSPDKVPLGYLQLVLEVKALGEGRSPKEAHNDNFALFARRAAHGKGSVLLQGRPIIVKLRSGTVKFSPGLIAKEASFSPLPTSSFWVSLPTPNHHQTTQHCQAVDFSCLDSS